MMVIGQHRIESLLTMWSQWQSASLDETLSEQQATPKVAERKYIFDIFG